MINLCVSGVFRRVWGMGFGGICMVSVLGLCWIWFCRMFLGIDGDFILWSMIGVLFVFFF